MCGIAGLLSLDGRRVDGAPLATMLDRIVHRGPDDRGEHVDGPVALGMTRLSIVDLSTGHQPMSDPEGEITVVFNGELYGFRETRRELERMGYAFRTQSDTEVLIHGYRAWGDDVARHVRGMFAFALWDARRRRLLIARDRVGEKPLYYAVVRGVLAFGSELKCLTGLAGFDSGVDLASLDEYLAYGYVGAPRSFYTGARKLPPAHRMVVEDGRIRVERYHRFGETRVELPSSFDELCDRVDVAVRDAVVEQMVSDVPLGAFLSGGIDSSVVVAAMTRAGGERVRTFCAVFDEADVDERRHAAAVAAHLGTDHTELPIRADLATTLPALVADFDEPFGDKSMLPTYLVAREARRHVRVVLTGDGGDELFGGYRSYLVSMQRAERHARRPALLDAAMRSVAGRIPRGLPHAFRLRKRALDPVGRFAAGSMVFTPDDRRGLLSVETRRAMQSFDALALRLAADEPGRDVLERMQRIDLDGYLPGDILVKVDRMTMLASLESRAPLLDPRLVDLALALPREAKVRDGVGKRVLRAVCARYVPSSIAARPKQGFAIPTRAWLDGELADLVRDTLAGRALRECGFFEKAALDTMRRSLEGSHPPVDRLFRLLCLGLFLESRREAT